MTYLIHKAVELDKVKKALRPTEEQLIRDYIVQPKFDGCAMVAIHDYTGVRLLSRTGEAVKSAKHIEQALSASAPGVYIGEYWHSVKRQNEISGMFRKQDGTQYPEALMIIFDYLTLEEWANGRSDRGYAERRENIPAFKNFAVGYPLRIPLSLSCHAVTLSGGPSWVSSLLSEFSWLSSAGCDGLIFRRPDGKWIKGSNGTEGEIVKIKPTLTLDLRVIGIETAVGEKTGRTVYKVIVSLLDGKLQTVGSGVPHNPDELPKPNDIVEIEAMSRSANGLLREPRYKGIRYDKLEPDES